jgi:hypothetical protein
MSASTAVVNYYHSCDVRLWPIGTDDALTANRRFRGIADMKRFSAPDDLWRMTVSGHTRENGGLTFRASTDLPEVLRWHIASPPCNFLSGASIIWDVFDPMYSAVRATNTSGLFGRPGSSTH